jgi:hypothetical protein
MDKIRQIFGVLWQLPQFLVGWTLKWWYTRDCVCLLEDFRGVEAVYSSKMKGGIALGNVIILPRKYAGVFAASTYIGKARNHEFGHCRQSRMLGWFYLPVIGLPSLCWAAAHSTFKGLSETDYYSFYTEKWADKLGGVER